MSENHANVWPTFRYRDAKAAISFLQEALGFDVIAEYMNADDPDRVDHAELAWTEGGGVMLGSVRDDGGVMTKTGVASGSVGASAPGGASGVAASCARRGSSSASTAATMRWAPAGRGSSRRVCCWRSPRRIRSVSCVPSAIDEGLACAGTAKKSDAAIAARTERTSASSRSSVRVCIAPV